MNNKKFQIFVSSTYLDLKKERQAAVQAILEAGHIPAGMELFTAGDQSQWEVIKRWIDECDIFMLILGGRYGSIEPGSGKSYIHLEYEYAKKNNKPLFALVANDEALNNRARQTENGFDKLMERYNPSQLKDFKQLVQSRMIDYWDDEKDIKIQTTRSINELANQKGKELSGWTKEDNSQNIDNQKAEVYELKNKMLKLRARISELEKENESFFRDDPLDVTYCGFTFEEIYKILDSELVIDKDKIELNSEEWDSVIEHASCDPDEISLALQDGKREKIKNYLNKYYFSKNINIDENKKQALFLRTCDQYEKLLDTMRSFGDKHISMIHLLWLLRFKRDKFDPIIYSPLKVNWELLKIYGFIAVKNNPKKPNSMLLSIITGEECREEWIFTKLGQTFLNGLIRIRQTPKTSQYKF